MIVLGFDTSCYTTSAAVFQGETLLGDARKMLPVKPGEMGLRQSDALFHHHKHMPELIEELATVLKEHPPELIACSVSPRPVEGSYMPVFLSGEQTAQILSSVYGCPVYKVSHQEGHVRAAVWNASFDDQEPFLALHLSGGTTEILLVKKNHLRYDIEIVGGTKDISAGMLLDRTGVFLGYPFPAGKWIDQLACESPGVETRYPIAVQGTWMNLSGLENKAQQGETSGVPKDVIAWNLMDAITRSLAKTLAEAIKITGCRKILFSGGVASSRYLRRAVPVHKLLSHTSVSFAEGRYSVDNAVGVALMGVDALRVGDK